MRISALTFQNFGPHGTAGRTDGINFPTSGVTCITGENGAGKSFVIEGVGWAFWGESLRGASLLPRDPKIVGPTRVQATLLNGVRAERFASTSGKKHLSWELRETDATDPEFAARVRLGDPRLPEFGTTSKSEEALERVVGSFDAWRRSCVFSSADAAHFSQSTDKERKEFLERMLGLERFSSGLARCRERMKIVASELTRAKGEADRARLNVCGMRRTLKELREASADVRAALPEEPKKDPTLSERYREALEALESLEKEDRELGRLSISADGELLAAEKEAKRFSGETCPTCEQPMPKDRKEAAAARLEGARGAADAKRREAYARRSELSPKIDEVRRRGRAIDAARLDEDAKTRAWTREAEDARRREEALAKAEKRVAELEERIAEGDDLVDSHDAEALAARRELSELEAVEEVLGLRGVRARLLDRSLDGISDVANGWLPRFGRPDLRVQLRPFTEKKSGGVSDAISIELEGAGEGNGYRGASGGERRRVDLALLLGVSEIAAGASGGPPGTLFLDEVFDAIDPESVADVAEAIEEIGRSRPVVLITHNPELAKRVRASCRVHFQRKKA